MVGSSDNPNPNAAVYTEIRHTYIWTKSLNETLILSEIQIHFSVFLFFIMM